MTKKVCIRYFNSDLKETGEVFEYQQFSSFGNSQMRTLEFIVSPTEERIYNFDRIISIRLFEDESG